MERGEIGVFPTGVDILAAHRCNQVTPKRVMGVVIMVGGSHFFCLAPCLYVCNSFNLVVVVVTPTSSFLLTPLSVPAILGLAWLLGSCLESHLV